MDYAPSAELRSSFGEIDIYLFDQLLKGRFDRRTRVLDAGCGDGRNLVYFLQHGFNCHAVDREPAAIARTRAIAARLAPSLPADQFRVAELDALPFDDESVDAVVCSAVLHFADDRDHCRRMIGEVWRVLAPDGLFFARLASNIGIEAQIGADAGDRLRLPDGSDRFVVDERLLRQWTADLGAELLDPLKTTNVDRVRAMTTWCLHKP